MKKEYALYKGEDCLAIGTIKEIADELKVQYKTVVYYGTPTYKKRRKNSKKGNYRTLIKLEEDM